MKKYLYLLLFLNSLVGFSQTESWNKAPKELVDLYKSAYQKYNTGNLLEAISDVTKATKIDSNYRAAYAFRGDLFYQLKDYSSALKDYNKSLEISQYNSFRTLASIGHVKFELKDYTASFKIFTKLESEGIDIGVKYYKAISAYHLKEYKIAIEGFNKSILFHSNEGNSLGYQGDTKACYYRGNSKFQLKDYAGAVKDYDIVISRKKSSFTSLSYYERGLAKKNIKQPYATDFKKACELGVEEACELYSVFASTYPTKISLDITEKNMKEFSSETSLKPGDQVIFKSRRSKIRGVISEVITSGSEYLITNTENITDLKSINKQLKIKTNKIVGYK